MSTARDDQGDKTCLGARKPLLATTMTTTTPKPIPNTTTTATAKNLSPQPSTNRNKFTLDEVGEQLRSIRKLSETSDFLSSNVIELNNNTILASSSSAPPPLQETQQPLKSQQQQFAAGQPLTLNQLRMDIRRSGEVSGNQEPQAGVQPASAPYTSLFSPTYGRDTGSSRQSTPASHLQPATRQHQLRKQPAALDLDLPIAAVNHLPVQQVPVKKMGAFASSPSQQKEVLSSSSTSTTTTQEDEEEDEVDEVEEEDLDERLPFNASHLPRLGSGRKASTSASPSRKRNSTSPARGGIKPQHSVISFDSKCEYVKRNSSNINNTKAGSKKNISNKHHQQQARISLVDSRPPSFSACQQQPGYIHLNNNKEILAGRKLDWQHHHHQQQHQQQKTFSRCDCSNCHKKFSSLVLKSSANYPSGPILQPASSKYPKTYSMHMVLKSIILILVTLLLSMLFLGVIMATHYMPHAIERLLNTPRTFNVTIATG